MGSNGSDEVMASSVEEAECSETTVEIKIKTLDSQTYTLRVNKRVPVPELKEQIETVTGVISEQQRLICRGKVLKDDQLLSAYHVEDGHTLHLVVRQPIPPSATSATGFMGSESLQDHPGTIEFAGSDPAVATGQHGGAHVAHRVLLGSFNIAEQGGGIQDLNRIISAVLSSLTGSTGGSDHMDLGADRLERTSGANLSPDSNQPQLDEPTAVRAQFDPLHGAFRIPATASLGSLQPPVIPDSLTTLIHYLSHLRHEFSSIGGSQVSSNGEREQATASRSDLGQTGLPTAASLAEVIWSTRQLLLGQTGERLSELARQLEDQTNLTTTLLRNNIQTSAVRTGIALQNLGALLLELGRTTMTLRMGQIPSDAVVNAGPAVFISTSGPNPIMVQPLQPGAGFGATMMGALNAGSGLLGGTHGSGLFPRNIDIRIRAGPSSTGNVNQGEQDGTQQSPAQTGPERTSNSAGSVHQQGVAAAGGPAVTREAGVRALPLRTVVAAVPASAGRPTSISSGSSLGLFYPLLSRVQHLTSGQSNNAGGAQASSEQHSSVPGADYQRIPDSAMHQQNATTGAALRSANPVIPSLFPNHGTSSVSEVNPANIVVQIHHQGILQIPNRTAGAVVSQNSTQQNGQSQNAPEYARQVPRSEQLRTESANAQGGNEGGADTHNAAPSMGISEGIVLSRLLHQIFPLISQHSVPEASGVSDGVEASENRSSYPSSTQNEDSPCAGTSHPRDDHNPPSPSSKRQKRE